MYKSIQKQFFLIFIGLCVSMMAQSADEVLKISVSADHADWVYKLHEKVKFKIVVTKNGEILNNVKICYEIGPEKMTAQMKDTAILKQGEIQIEAGTLTTPGFLRCKVRADYENNTYEGLATAAFEPEKIAPTTTTPNNFMSFWENAIAENYKIPLDSKMTLLTDKCTEKVNVYEVSIQNCRLGMRVYGILCVPKKVGKYPAILQVPGAGIRPYDGDTKLAELGIIVFQIGIHGIPVTLNPTVYSDLYNGVLKYYRFYNLDDKDNYYYKHVYLGCIRAIDFIYTLPEYDGSSLAVSGGSQGGALSIVTAALDKRVKCLSCFYPALSDMTGYLYGRAGGWPHMFSKTEAATKEKVETTRYYDVVNFAKLLTVPGFYSFGFNDEVCPPTTIYAAYNCITAPAELYIVKETGHFRIDGQAAKSNEFLFKQLKLTF